MNHTPTTTSAKRWYDYIPHPAVMLFFMLILASVMSYIIPAGEYARELVDGRERVVPGSYKEIPATPVGLLDMFVALPIGFKTAIDIIFIVLASGIMFGFLERSGAVENAVGTLVRKLGLQKRYLIVVVMTFVFGGLGAFVGYAVGYFAIQAVEPWLVQIGLGPSFNEAREALKEQQKGS